MDRVGLKLVEALTLRLGSSRVLLRMGRTPRLRGLFSVAVGCLMQTHAGNYGDDSCQQHYPRLQFFIVSMLMLVAPTTTMLMTLTNALSREGDCAA